MLAIMIQRLPEFRRSRASCGCGRRSRSRRDALRPATQKAGVLACVEPPIPFDSFEGSLKRGPDRQGRAEAIQVPLWVARKYGVRLHSRICAPEETQI